MFFDIDPMGFPQGASFYYNLVILVISIPFDSTVMPKEFYDLWYIGGITETRPFAIYFFRDPNYKKYDYELYSHCVLEIDENGEICWYDMIDYDTEDPWILEPIIDDEEEE